MVLGLHPISIWAQQPGDSAEVNIDSIQDLRVNRLERRLDQRINRMEGSLHEEMNTIDSLYILLEDLQQHLRYLELEKQEQLERLSLLQEDVEHTNASALEYRSGLHRILWISGSILFILLLSSFLYLLLYTHKTRMLLERLNWKLKRIRSRFRTLRKDLKSGQKEFHSDLKSKQKILRSELESRQMNLRAEMKSGDKSIQKKWKKQWQSLKPKKRKRKQ